MNLALVALFAGATCIALSPIWVRLADVGPTASAFWRVALAVPLLWILHAAASKHASGRASATPAPRAHRGYLAAAGVAFAAIGIALGHWAQVRYDNRDPRQFVLDEAAGQMLALVGITHAVLAAARWKAALAAFIFFRLFDIIKPFPAGRAERLNAGWGIVLDDIVAGLYAAVATHLWLQFVK